MNDYISFIAKSLVNFINIFFSKPFQALKEPDFIFAFGHILILFAFLI